MSRRRKQIIVHAGSAIQSWIEFSRGASARWWRAKSASAAFHRRAFSKRCLRVPRHEFVPAEFQSDAYADKPLPIGEGQTISQPYIVAAMTEALELTGTERVLEIGAGSGYQAAVLSLLATRSDHRRESNVSWRFPRRNA